MHFQNTLHRVHLAGFARIPREPYRSVLGSGLPVSVYTPLASAASVSTFQIQVQTPADRLVICLHYGGYDNNEKNVKNFLVCDIKQWKCR